MRSGQLSLALLFLCIPASLPAQQVPAAPPAAPVTAEAIMAKVAQNQDRAEAERTHYVYLQHARVASRKGSRAMCEELTDFRVTPLPTGSQKSLLSLDGKLWHKGSYVTYHQLPPATADADKGTGNTSPDEDDDMDRDLVENLRKNLTDEASRDGFHAGLFPLTGKGQAGYTFTLAGREHMNGRDVFHIVFRPKDTSDFDWKGDAYIDAEALQPVLVRTRLSRNVPFLVRTMLGTSVPGLGFSATYAPQTDGLWFPSTFGTEFKINVLFFLRRHITIAVQNDHFEKTHASGRILGEATVIPPEPITKP